MDIEVRPYGSSVTEKRTLSEVKLFVDEKNRLYVQKENGEICGVKIEAHTYEGSVPVSIYFTDVRATF